MRSQFEKVSRFHLRAPQFLCQHKLSIFLFSICFILLSLYGSSVHSADFREKALNETEKEALQTTISQLASTSSRIREEAGRNLLKYGCAAIPFLQEACRHEDLTIAETADFYLQMLRNGLHRTGDPTQVTEILKRYETSRLQYLRQLPIYSLTYLPTETALTPLLRLTLHEKTTRLSQLAALGTYRVLPGKRPLPQFPILFPEERPYPDPHFWETENQKAHEARKALIREIRHYLLSEPVQTSGKQLLLALLSLEEELTQPGAPQTPVTDAQVSSVPPTQTDSLQTGAGKPKESGLAVKKIQAFRNRFLETADAKFEPMDLLFIRELDLSLCCLLYQAGAPKEADEFFQNVFLRHENQLRKNPLPSMEMHNNFVILFFRQGQTLLHEGHTGWSIQLLDSLWKDMEMREKNQISPLLLSTWKNLGQYTSAIELAREIKHISFLSKNSEAHEDVDKMAAILVSLHSQKDIQQQKFSEARTRLKIYLDKTTQEDLDIDLLILSRQLAQHMEDDAWLQALNVRILEHLQSVQKKISILTQNPFTPLEEKSSALNEFAWLAANTGFHLEKALEYAKEMTQLSPNSAGLTDTLAMVYFVRKEYEKAFEVQKKAHELDPTEPVILQNLERFRVWLPQK